jgi:hypothetical protein
MQLLIGCKNVKITKPMEAIKGITFIPKFPENACSSYVRISQQWL